MVESVEALQFWSLFFGDFLIKKRETLMRKVTKKKKKEKKEESEIKSSGEGGLVWS